MDLVSLYFLPLQMQMSVQESPAWTLSLAKILLEDITATVFVDGPDKTVTSVSISSLFFYLIFFKSHLNFRCFQTSPLTSWTHYNGCSLASLASPHVVTTLLFCPGKTNHRDWTRMHSCLLRIHCMPSSNLCKVHLALYSLH